MESLGEKIGRALQEHGIEYEIVELKLLYRETVREFAERLEDVYRRSREHPARLRNKAPVAGYN